MIDPNVFTERMTKHWTEELCNIANEPLRQTWAQIAKTLNEHIRNHSNPDLAKKWSVLQPPTGSGKTQSLILYSSMLADLSHEDHPGILIVTRLIDDCKSIVKQINNLADTETALAYHSKANIKLDELKEYPVVVITHTAYQNALDYLGDSASIRQTWPYFHNWQTNNRKLVVIDECIDIVESNQAGLDGLRQTLAAIPQEVRNEHPSDVTLIESIIEVLEKIADTPGKHEDMMMDGEHKLDFTPEEIDICGLISSLKVVRFDVQNGKNDVLECERLRQRHTKRLKDLQHILQSWSYYSGVKKEHTLHTARLLVPEDTKGAVVFDATATQNVIYQLFENAFIIDSPDGTRDYSNVTLHISRGHKVGKSHMKRNANRFCKDLISELNPVLGKDSKALIVCHKGVEPILNKYDTSFEMHTGHWGKIDGSNNWKDCDSAVIFGLPYRPDYWAADVFMALQEPTSTEWLRDHEHRRYGNHADIRQAIKHGQIATDVIQAVNRVRCRKVVDTYGNCQETHIFILLPDDSLSDELIGAIKNQMPNIKVTDWNYTGQKKKPKASKHEASLVKYIQNMEPECKVSVGYVGKELGISISSMKRLKKTAKKQDSSLNLVFKKSNVYLKTERAGKTQKTYFIKG